MNPIKQPPRISRALHAIAFAIVLTTLTATLGASPTAPRGGRVSWGRLITGSGWDIHADRDPDLARFIQKETTLNINPTWYSADPSSLDQLCQFPFLYVKDLSRVHADADVANLREYLLRGGFLCVDACIARLDINGYYRGSLTALQRILPGGELRQLPVNHPAYHCYFHVRPDDIFTRDMGTHVPGQYEGLYGWFYQDRMIAVVTIYGLECGWPQTPMRTPGCMKMIVNLYVYAMTRGTEANLPPK